MDWDIWVVCETDKGTINEFENAIDRGGIRHSFVSEGVFVRGSVVLILMNIVLSGEPNIVTAGA